jgi:hypothetical protein
MAFLTATSFTTYHTTAKGFEYLHAVTSATEMPKKEV